MGNIPKMWSWTCALQWVNSPWVGKFPNMLSPPPSCPYYVKNDSSHQKFMWWIFIAWWIFWENLLNMFFYFIVSCVFQAKFGHFFKLKFGKKIALSCLFFNNIFRIPNMWLAVMSKNIYSYKELAWMKFWENLMVLSCASNKITQYDYSLKV
jgi:hypothetical protein